MSTSRSGSLKILMLLFCRRHEGTYYRAYPWARCLARGGHRVTLMCVAGAAGVTGVDEDEDGVRVIETTRKLEGRWAMARLSGMYGWGPGDIRRRTRELHDGGYDVVHTFEHHPNVSFPIYLAGHAGRPVLVVDGCDHYGRGGFRGAEYSPYRLALLYRILGGPLRLVMDFIERDLRRRADAVTVISGWLRRRAIDFGIPAARVHLIPGSADVEHVVPKAAAAGRRELGIPDGAPVVGFLGGGQFDLDFSLHAIAIMLRSRPDLRFVVIGRRDETVTATASRLGLADRVIQTGWITDAQLPTLLAAADVFLLPLKRNPVNLARWPNKIGSYMAAGRPTVCTDVGDVADLVRAGDVGRVTVPEPAAFAAAVLQLIANPAVAAGMGVRARELAVARFAEPIQGAQIEIVYRNLLEQRHG